MKSIIASLFLLFPLIVSAQELEQIKSDLNDIFKESLQLRFSVVQTIKNYGSESAQLDSLNRLVIEFDSLSLIKVREVVDKQGWLGISKIGKTPNQAMFLTIQHAQDKEIRMKYFPLLKASAENKESNLSDMAKMQDRILVENGEKQLYATQSKMVDNKLELFPIADPENVNKRRRKVGLKKVNKKELLE